MHQHRSGSLKQANKGFKSKHATKGAIKRSHGGKVDVKTNSTKALLADRKDQRKNKLKQQRLVKRDRLQQQYRGLATGEAPPRVVSIIPIGDTIHTSSALHQEIFNEAKRESDPSSSIFKTILSQTFNVSKWKQRISLIPCVREITSILQAVQVSNVLVFYIPDSGIDEAGYETLRIIRAHGFPSLMACTESQSKSPQVRKAVEKQLCYEFAEKNFKVSTIHNMTDVLRNICQIGLQEEPLSRLLPRPFLMADQAPVFFENNGTKGVEMSGYLRGGSLSANQLVHVAGFGDYQIEAILSSPDPHPTKANHHSMGDDQSNRKVLSSSTPESRESLEGENEPDPMAGEQPLWNPDAGVLTDGMKRVPKGTSSYQASWIAEEGDEEEEEKEEKEGNMAVDAMDDTVPTPQLENFDDEDEEYEFVNPSDTTNMADSAAKRQLEQEDIDYPDEMETPKEIPARVRFQRYRGLKSFRTSPWDTKEELPRDYSKIFQFRSMQRTQNRILDEHEGVPSGQYITIQIIDAPKALVESYSVSSPLIAIGLFPYERKVSVLNFTLRRTTNYTEPIASKDDLIFVCGGRTLLTKPLFSEHSVNSDKHKYERFWLPITTSVATIYGPTMFTPTPLLVFKKLTPSDPSTVVSVNGLILVGSGALLSVNPDRLAIKKVALTGEPFKVLKRKAVIRSMFHNPEDIQWFKPVELRTRLGHIGNVLESIGLHGHMRCLFDSQLKQHDVIMMNLYKRVFPVWKSSYDLHPQCDEDSHNI